VAYTKKKLKICISLNNRNPISIVFLDILFSCRPHITIFSLKVYLSKYQGSRHIVVGMTIRVGQGQSHLPAGVPGIIATTGQRGRLQPKGRLRQGRLATSSPKDRAGEDDETPPTDILPTAAWPQQGRQRQETSVTPTTPGLHQPAGKTLLHERIRGRAEDICSEDAGPRGKGTL
jgi:hypothetical protein